MMPKILLQINSDLTQALEPIMQQAGYEIMIVSDVRAALETTKSEAVDVALFDLDEPKIGGISFLHKLQGISPATQIILIAKQITSETIFSAIRSGVHDCIKKPYQTKELLSSVEKALERCAKEKRIQKLIEQLENTLNQLKSELGISQIPKARTKHIALPNSVLLDLLKRVMWRGTVEVRLTSAEANLLRVFVMNWGRVLTFEELVFLTQGYGVDVQEAPEILRPLISRLRKKLRAFDGAHWIASIRSDGYLFDADLPDEHVNGPS